MLYAKALGLIAKVNFLYYDILYSFYNIRSTWAFPLIIPPDNAMPVNGSTKESSSKLLYYCVLQIDPSNQSTTLPPSRAWPTPSQKEGRLIPTSPWLHWCGAKDDQWFLTDTTPIHHYDVPLLKFSIARIFLKACCPNEGRHFLKEPYFSKCSF